MTLPDRLDISKPSFKSDPFPIYAELRAERPVCRVNLPMLGEAFLLTRYDDVSSMLKDVRFAKDPANAPMPSGRKRRAPPRLFAPLTRNMLGLDDPDHARFETPGSGRLHTTSRCRIGR